MMIDDPAFAAGARLVIALVERTGTRDPELLVAVAERLEQAWPGSPLGAGAGWGLRLRAAEAEGSARASLRLIRGGGEDERG